MSKKAENFETKRINMAIIWVITNDSLDYVALELYRLEKEAYTYY